MRFRLLQPQSSFFALPDEVRWRPALRSHAVLSPLRGIDRNRSLTCRSTMSTSVLDEHVSVKFFADHLFTLTKACICAAASWSCPFGIGLIQKAPPSLFPSVSVYQLQRIHNLYNFLKVHIFKFLLQLKSCNSRYPT